MTDHEGNGVVAQLSVGVVDKAVYAIQSEFRPKVLDFFYPPARNNVSNFYSAEFQGYGYGEALARKMAGLPDHAFASIKPPTRKAKDEERDTAFWEPNVVTDRRARHGALQAAVQPDAVGGDGGGGGWPRAARHREFATRGGLNLYAALPQFLRVGDEDRLGAPVRGHGLQGQPALGRAARLDVFANQAQQKVELGEGGEQVIPLQLKATGPGAAELAVDVTGGKEPLKDRRAVPVRPRPWRSR